MAKLSKRASSKKEISLIAEIRTGLYKLPYLQTSHWSLDGSEPDVATVYIERSHLVEYLNHMIRRRQRGLQKSSR